MAIEFKRTKVAGHFPEIWRGECRMLPGGFKPAQDFAVGTVLHRGTPLYVDFETMTAAVCKTAMVRPRRQSPQSTRATPTTMC